jgi:hypothetical protein
VPSEPHEQEETTVTLATAADVLGWTGIQVPNTELFGTRTHMVAAVDPDRLTRRRRMHRTPVLDDPDTLTMWEWPDGNWPPSPVTLAGVIVPADAAWHRGLTVASRWRGFAPTAVMLSGMVADDDLLFEADYRGVAVVARAPSGVRLVQDGASRTGPRRTVVDRWVEEQLYARLIADDLLAPAVSRG